MFGFGKKAKAIRVLEAEFDLDRRQIIEPFLDIFVTKNNNEFDVALSYMIARARSVSSGDATTESYFKSHLAIVVHLAGRATDPEKIRELAQLALNFRIEQYHSWHPTYESWIETFKLKCGEINPMLAVDEQGGSFVDFLMDDGFRRAHRDRVDPEYLAERFAPTFHPDNFGR